MQLKLCNFFTKYPDSFNKSLTPNQNKKNWDQFL